jgi:hypothetical protein
MLLIRNNERQEGDGLACARRHFEDGLAADVQRPFEIAHVGILLWIYARIWEENLQLPVDISINT